ncbi:hypothetical protein [Pontibacter rugosus]|uniref:Uncharacterized protein n=1 Tax=Pontibacter rugosus TaxID=1745966 RepID=A0ABW3SWX8_9BACT
MLLLLIGTPGYSQVNYQAEENHEQKLKQSLKDAAKVDAVTYKDTHLNTSAYTYKKGVAGRKRLRNEEREQYQFDTNGEPVKRKGLFKKKKKYRQRGRNKRSN